MREMLSKQCAMAVRSSYIHYPRFFDISFVFIGADRTSFVLEKIASGSGIFTLWLREIEKTASPRYNKSLRTGHRHSSQRNTRRRVKRKVSRQRKLTDLSPSRSVFESARCAGRGVRAHPPHARRRLLADSRRIAQHGKSQRARRRQSAQSGDAGGSRMPDVFLDRRRHEQDVELKLLRLRRS